MISNTKQTIVFINVFDESIEKPTPAIECLPSWYKDTPPYIGKNFPISNDSNTNGTIKKCVPVLDALSSGYILFSHGDIWVTIENNSVMYHWRGPKLIEMQAKTQVPEHPAINSFQDIPKFINPWGIKTPKGYSTLFIPPMHRDTPIQILPGVVDTDKYHSPVNLPFMLSNGWFEGLIPAGTPIAQIIPFKRDEWVSEESNKKEDIKESSNQTKQIMSRFYHGYKDLFWNRKSYK